MKLNQISANDSVTQTVVNAMMAASPVLMDAEFYAISGNAEYARKAATADGGDFRALNSNYPANQVDPEFVLAALKIFGDTVEVDRAHERRGKDIASERARQLLQVAKNIGKNFTDKFFNATVNATDFDGLKALVPNAQILTPAADGFEVLAGNDNAAKKSQQKFLENLRNAKGMLSAGASALYMNLAVLNRLTSIAADYIQWVKDDFGMLVPFFDGIPIRNAGLNSTGSEVLPSTEVCGNSANTSSVFAVAWGEASELSVATSVGVEAKDLGLVGVHYTHSIDFDAVPVLLNPKAVAQLKGIIIA
ncbi:MAG: hypothetical protein HBSAPP04_13070 [Ignavibacteriaceae bacterium]|nr:MAG: hypothetical protein HBSAPP04_13070 [Ignavibacteriaceae bacterium]